MFPFDPSLLPQLPTRKALIAIDFQVDFFPQQDPTGLDPYKPKLPIECPASSVGLVDRVIDLAEKFRSSGNIVCWSQSLCRGENSVEKELPPSRYGGACASKDDQAQDDKVINEDPDAFLSPGPDRRPPCVQPSTTGASLHPLVAAAVKSNPRDICITKTHYSVFKNPTFLQRLRVNFVTELFLCGSIVNAGVYATAIEAAGHGYAITVIDDCCGGTDKVRRDTTIKNLVKITGCEVLDHDSVVRILTKADQNNGFRDESRRDDTPTRPGPIFPSTEADDTGINAPPDISKTISQASGGDAELHTDSGPSEPETTTAGRPNIATERSDEKHVTKPEPDGKLADGERRETVTPPLDGPQSGDERAETTATAESVVQQDVNLSTITPITPAEDAEDENSIVLQLGGLTLKDEETKSHAADASDGEPKPDGAKSRSHTLLPSPPASSLKPDDTPICEGDTIIVPSILPPQLADTAYDALLSEVKWDRMSHQGGEVPRRVAVQGSVDPLDGSIPVYRHPADASPPLLPFTPTVLEIKEAVKRKIGHEVNHVLIQHYRSGHDFISEHSDKTLDIVPGSFICNLSLGAERTMVFRTKRNPGKEPPTQTDPAASPDSGASPEPPSSSSGSRSIVRVKLPHNSLCQMGLGTNMKWLHAIRPDKRMDSLKSEDELAYSGGRISLTFRHIGTFLSADESVIWGQGATSKFKDSARPVINGQGPETIKLLHAFGTENHSSDFDWDGHYGKGFDVLHMRTAARLFTGADPIANMRVALMLAECGIGYAKGSVTGICETQFGMRLSLTELLQSRPIKFCDSDDDRTTVEGDVSILWYLDTHHYKASRGRAAHIHAKQLTALEHGVVLLRQWHAVVPDELSGQRDIKQLRPRLAILNGLMTESDFIVEGSDPSVADFTIWPVLHGIVGEVGAEKAFVGVEKLRRFYDRFEDRESVVSFLEGRQRRESVPGSSPAP